MKKPFLIAAAACVAALLHLFLAYLIMISPQNLSDIAAEKRMLKMLNETGEVDMAQVTDFEWDILYYSWNSYGPSVEIEPYVSDPNHIIRTGDRETYSHMLFVKDGILVKQYIMAGKVELDHMPFLDGTYVSCDAYEVVFSSFNGVAGAVFTKETAVFTGKKSGTAGYDLYPNK